MIEATNLYQILQDYEFQLAGGKPAGYLQAWPRIWTRDYRQQIQLAVRAVRVQHSNRSATLPPCEVDYPQDIVQSS